MLFFFSSFKKYKKTFNCVTCKATTYIKENNNNKISSVIRTNVIIKEYNLITYSSSFFVAVTSVDGSRRMPSGVVVTSTSNFQFSRWRWVVMLSFLPYRLRKRCLIDIGKQVTWKTVLLVWVVYVLCEWNNFWFF